MCVYGGYVSEISAVSIEEHTLCYSWITKEFRYVNMLE